MRVRSTRALPRVDIFCRAKARVRANHGDAGGGGEEILHRQADHLAEITHCAFAGVSLPVSIADKADRGIERQIP